MKSISERLAENVSRLGQAIGMMAFLFLKQFIYSQKVYSQNRQI